MPRCAVPLSPAAPRPPALLFSNPQARCLLASPSLRCSMALSPPTRQPPALLSHGPQSCWTVTPSSAAPQAPRQPPVPPSPWSSPPHPHAGPGAGCAVGDSSCSSPPAPAAAKNSAAGGGGTLHITSHPPASPAAGRDGGHGPPSPTPPSPGPWEPGPGAEGPHAPVATVKWGWRGAGWRVPAVGCPHCVGGDGATPRLGLGGVSLRGLGGLGRQ